MEEAMYQVPLYKYELISSASMPWKVAYYYDPMFAVE